MCSNCIKKASAALLLSIALKRKKRKQKGKRIWSQLWYKKRNVLGQKKLLRELEFTSQRDFKNYVRMDKETFEVLLSKVAHRINKRDTVMRKAIPARHRLTLTLRFLASGNSFEDLKFLTAISPQAIGKIVSETCDAIIEELKDYIKLPTNENEWKMEANAFNQRWNFPHCIGAIDGKHVNIKKPPGSGSFYFNYKKHFSIIMMAVVNANYEFLMVDVGANGRASDAGLFSQTKFFKQRKENKLRLPKPELLPGYNEKMPFVFVADDAFPLMENIMKPFSHNSLEKSDIIFNYRLSRARGLVENVFGILVSRFRILLNTLNFSPDKSTKFVLACCYLHNFLRKSKCETYFTAEPCSNVETTEAFETPGSQEKGDVLDSLSSTAIRNASANAKHMRNKFRIYFSSVGTVPWQDKVYNKLVNKNANSNKQLI
ncbi:putative nuclease HARBI1 [Eurosta solidaginis]|uniref:putative nuclease HARBI1 n=1 Tax=Eurosta solidaginis TaxID=178769 RepID=UPI0035312047